MMARARGSARASREYARWFHLAPQLRSTPQGVRGPVQPPPSIRQRRFRLLALGTQSGGVFAASLCLRQVVWQIGATQRAARKLANA
jgi:hypothetical protein